MKTTYSIQLLIFALFAFCGCKNNNTVLTSYEARKIVPKYLIRITHTNASGIELTDFVYDDQKRLSTVKTGNRLTVSYTYNTNTVASIDARATEGGNVTRNLYTFGYTADILKSTNQKTYINNVLTKESNYTHEVTRGVVMRSVMEPGDVTTQYTFGEGNITSVTGATTLNYVYDNQKSIYFNLPTAFPLPGDIADRFSKNNVVKAISPNGSTVNYTYTYDVDGYPIAMLTGAERYTFAYATF